MKHQKTAAREYVFHRDPSPPPIRRCFVCNAPRPDHAIGWEELKRMNLDPRDLCPRHRQERRPAMATLGELVGAHQEKKDPHT